MIRGGEQLKCRRGFVQQYIEFNLGNNEYAVPILKVREIINLPSITKLPSSPLYVEGITNLRGSVITIVNSKKLMNINDDKYAANKVIVLSSGSITFGILVDNITGVIHLEESEIEPPERFLNNNTDKLDGVAKLNDKLLIILNTKNLIPYEDMSLFEDIVVDVKETCDGNVVVTKKSQSIAGEINIKEIQSAKNFFEKKGLSSNDPKYVIFDDMVSFMDAIANNDPEKAESAIQNIMKKGQSDLFQEIGRVTRKLHDAIKSFKEAIDPKLKDMAKTEMPNAIDSLQFVIGKTEEAAHKTMGIVEKYLLSMDDLSSEIRKLKEPEDAVNYLRNFKNRLEDDLTDILTTQSFQDITGQTIVKVIKLVSDIEEELVRLIATFGVKIDTEAKTTEGSPEKVSQSGVDELLKDFGF